MPADVTLIAAFLVGLLGSTHCIGMCGGIVGALTFSVPGQRLQSPRALLPYLLAYNAGRIVSYGVAGALLGWLSVYLFGLVPPTQAQWIARLISGVFMIALGLYLSGWWTGLGLLERLGGKLWTRLEPVGRRLLPVDRPLKAFAFGLVWGWLPCGMVYATLAWSLAAGTPAQGALIMIAFGVGTLPMLLAMGVAAHSLRAMVRQPWLRRAVGLVLIILGSVVLAVPAKHDAHAHHASVTNGSPATGEATGLVPVNRYSSNSRTV